MIIDRLFYNKAKKDHIDSTENGIDYRNFDCKILKKLLNEYNSLVEVYDLYSDNAISEFLFDIREALKSCDLTEIQYVRLIYWFSGYNENEIAQKENVSRWVVSKSITAACKKILDYLQSKIVS